MAGEGEEKPGGNFFTEPITRRESFKKGVQLLGVLAGVAYGLKPDRIASAM